MCSYFRLYYNNQLKHNYILLIVEWEIGQVYDI